MTNERARILILATVIFKIAKAYNVETTTLVNLNETMVMSPDQIISLKERKLKGLSEAECKIMYSFTKSSKAFGNLSYEEASTFFAEIDAWDPPDELSKGFPYYLAGYDYERRPIWAAEIGRYDVRSIVEQGQESMDNLEKYLLKFFVNAIKSFIEVDKPDDEIRQAVLIGDMEHFTTRQISSVPTVAFGIVLVRKYIDLVLQGIGNVVWINTNYPTKVLIDLFRPYASRAIEKLETYGTNRNSWLPRLLRLFPIELLPPWYGGSPNFKPLEVYG